MYLAVDLESLSTTSQAQEIYLYKVLSIFFDQNDWSNYLHLPRVGCLKYDFIYRSTRRDCYSPNGSDEIFACVYYNNTIADCILESIRSTEAYTKNCASVSLKILSDSPISSLIEGCLLWSWAKISVL